jgi:uncharacterized iron-regulated membrane protein
MMMSLVLLAAVAGSPPSATQAPTPGIDRSIDQPPRSDEAAPKPPDSTQPPENGQHSSLTRALDTLQRDAVSVQQRDLSKDERARLALELRAEGSQVPSLVAGQPDRVKQLAFDVDQQTARLFTAINRNDRDGISREAGVLSTRMSTLRAAIAP